MRVAEKYTHLVLTYVTKEETDLRHEAVYGEHFDLSRKEQIYIPAERCAQWLREKEPVFAQVRAWCGAPALEAFDELTALRAENARLRTLISEEAKRLEETDQKREAQRLRRRLDHP